MEGFIAVKEYCNIQHVQLNIENQIYVKFNMCYDYKVCKYYKIYNLQLYFLIIKPSIILFLWITGISADIPSVSDTIWRTNNVPEISHRYLQIHRGNHHHPDPWMFLSNNNMFY